VLGVGEPGTSCCGLLHPLGMSPTSLLLLIVEEMALWVPADGGGSLDQLPSVGVHTPALATLSIQRHLALRREREREFEDIPCSQLPSLKPGFTELLPCAELALHGVPAQP
jgi:hypothetical protein